VEPSWSLSSPESPTRPRPSASGIFPHQGPRRPAGYILPRHRQQNRARAPTVFIRRDGHVLPLQWLYDGPYAVICRSLHHFTLRSGDKEDKVSTLKLKPCTDPTAPPAQPRVRRRPRSGSVWLTTHFTWSIFRFPRITFKKFLEQFYRTLSASKHLSTRHNTAAARQPPLQLPDDLARAPTVFMSENGSLDSV
jgi:hypothetical protein